MKVEIRIDHTIAFQKALSTEKWKSTAEVEFFQIPPVESVQNKM